MNKPQLQRSGELTMPEEIMTQTVFHSDDLKFILEYPKNTEGFSELSEDDFAAQVEIFARIMFEHIATKDNRKKLKIIKNDESGLYEYYVAPSTRTDTPPPLSQG
jgi:hypothetical protein